MMKNNIKRREFLRLIGIGSLTLSVSNLFNKAHAGSKQKPINIVLILADDVSPDMFGCYGNKEIRTPNIDRMAKEGVMFRTCWASALCSPARAEIMTGRYAHRTGVYHNSLQMPQPDGSHDLLKFHHSFAKLLRQAGYATAIAGKWHLGSGKPYDQNGGFDEYCLWSGLREISELPGHPKYNGGMENEDTTSRYWHPGIIQNGKLLKTKPDDFGPDIFTNFLCDFIERNKTRPFLAYYPMVAPHGTRKGHTTTPLRGKVGEMERASKKETQERFKALVEYVDVLVGRLMKKVEELGLLKNTIFIFTSDNGTAVTGKSRGVERGCRVPFVVWGDGIKKRGATDELTDFSDVFPTLLDFAGVKIPENYEIDGKSLKPFLTGKTDIHREWIYSVIGTTQLLRTKHYLLEAVNPMLGVPRGRFYYCGNSRDGKGYKNVTNSNDPEVVKARKYFDEVLKRFPQLTKDHPYFKTKRGKQFLKVYTDPKAIEKHLHNHPDYRFYEE